MINPDKKLLAQERVAAIFSLYEQHGKQDYIGEPVSQIEHMWQAAMLVKQEGHEEEVVLAAFFHDIGHLCVHSQNENMGGFGTKDHENIGAVYLKEMGFSDRLIKLVKSHVDAKRYLTFKFPDYYDQLSEASKQTLAYQGGSMTEQEALAFEADADFALMLRFRNWDDLAKQVNIPVNDLSELKEMALEVLLRDQ